MKISLLPHQTLGPEPLTSHWFPSGSTRPNSNNARQIRLGTQATHVGGWRLEFKQTTGSRTMSRLCQAAWRSRPERPAQGGWIKQILKPAHRPQRRGSQQLGLAPSLPPKTLGASKPFLPSAVPVRYLITCLECLLTLQRLPAWPGSSFQFVCVERGHAGEQK